MRRSTGDHQQSRAHCQLDDAGLTPYSAAPLIGMSARSLQQAVAGEIAMRGYAWLLLRVMLSQSARAELPAPLIA